MAMRDGAPWIEQAAAHATGNARLPGRRIATPLPFARMVEHIDRNVARRITVDELAGIAEVGVYALFRAFRREHATTPYRLVLEVRVRHAQRAIAAGATIAEAAHRAGFADQSHLTRHFKRIAGITPKRYAGRQAASAR
jgi:AraC-like DNA-binding protein